MDKDNTIRLVRELLYEIEGPELRSGLIETPTRVYGALTELLDGYDMDIDGLFKTFEGEGNDQVIAVKDIPFVSLCEHHCLEFSGLAHVAYLPDGKAIGASKIPRLVNAFAHRLQIQERITEQIGNTLMEKLNPRGVAVILQAEHSCMVCRGVRATGSKLVTSVMLGEFRENPTLRMEILNLLGLVR